MKIENNLFYANLSCKNTQKNYFAENFSTKNDIVSFSGMKNEKKNSVFGLAKVIFTYITSSPEEKERAEYIEQIRRNLFPLDENKINNILINYDNEFVKNIAADSNDDYAFALIENEYRDEINPHYKKEMQEKKLTLLVNFLQEFPKDSNCYKIATDSVFECHLSLSQVKNLFSKFYSENNTNTLKNIENINKTIRQICNKTSRKLIDEIFNIIISFNVEEINAYKKYFDDKELMGALQTKNENTIKNKNESSKLYNNYFIDIENSNIQVQKEKINQLKEFITSFYDSENPEKIEIARWCIVKAGKSIEETKKILSENNYELSNIKYNLQTKKIENEIINTLFQPNQLTNNNAIKNESIDYSTLNTYSNDDILNIINTNIEENNYDINEKDLDILFSNLSKKIDEYLKKERSDYNNNYSYILNMDYCRLKLELLNDLCSDMQNIIKDNKKECSETSFDYFNCIKNIYDESKVTENNVKKEKIEAGLSFSNTIESDEENKIILTKEEKQMLVDYVNHDRQTNLYTIDADMEILAEAWKEQYIRGGGSSTDEKSRRIDSACIQELPKYTPEVPYSPVARWMSFAVYNGDYDNFINSIPREGAVFELDRIQSCSKNLKFAENEFSDTNLSMNVKYIIYPKCRTSKAADLGMGKYGNNEVVYPAGTKFKVLYKELEEHNETEPKLSYGRYCIYLQEV